MPSSHERHHDDPAADVDPPGAPEPPASAVSPGDPVTDALADVAGMYTGNVNRLGAVSESVGWNDERTHRLRFDMLATLIDSSPEAAPFTVNDLGCGYGAMFRYLDETFPGRLARYTGYDISPEMLAAARRDIDDPRAIWIERGTIGEPADFGFVCGTFNVRSGAGEEAWTTYVESTLLDLARTSRRGFAFNLLTDQVDWRQDNLFYADPRHFFEFCRHRISRHVALRHDYPLYEWTMIVRTAT